MTRESLLNENENRQKHVDFIIYTQKFSILSVVDFLLSFVDSTSC